MHLSRLHVLLLIVAAGAAGYFYYQQKQQANPAENVGVTATPKPTPAPAKPAAPAAAPISHATPTPTPPPEGEGDDAKASSGGGATYNVKKGDTLWAIARDHSPCHAGAAWVGIWKANKKKIRDFDNLDGGLELMIPQTRAAYVTRFWKPRRFETVQMQREVDLAEVFRNVSAVDVAELPIPWSDQEVDVAELPLPDDSPQAPFAVTAFRAPVPPLVPYR